MPHATKFLVAAAALSLAGCGGGDPKPVSYTHLDVYKRQGQHIFGDEGIAGLGLIARFQRLSLIHI